MFRKNYDETIGKLIEANNNHVKSIESLRELFDSMQESMITMAKIQSQHKAIITFLINHASVDSDAQEDLFKMLGQIKQVEEDVKGEDKKRTKKMRKR